MKDAFESYALGLQLSHRALVRNLDRFVDVAASGTDRPDDLGAFVALYVDFLDVHHRSEDGFLFPALRRHAAGRSSDAAHLDRWTAEHHDVDRLARELADVARTLPGRTGPLADLGRTSRTLRELLALHVASEEEALSPQRLQEMIPADDLTATVAAVARANRSKGLALASFLATSLEPDEQRALLGETPWIFRKVILGVVGARRMRRFRSLVHTPSIDL